MDNKRTQRIIGIVVVIALVIILYPLFFGKSEKPAKTIAQNAPPFPEQTITADNKASDNDIAPQTADMQGDADVTQSMATPKIEAQNTAEITPEIADEVNKKLDAEVNKPQVIEQPATLPAVPSKVQQTTAQSANSAAQKTTPAKVATVAHKTLSPKVKSLHAKATSTDLSQLKKTAWVVQMGSFRDKDNARHLADKLRAAGFKAFMHEAKSGATRVFIGPEFKQTAAIKLSSKVEHDTKMRGIVVLYKPLAI